MHIYFPTTPAARWGHRALPPQRTRLICLAQEWLYDLAFHISETEVTALKTIGESFVIESKEVENGSLEIVDADLVASDGKSQSVGLAVNHALLPTRPAEKHRKARHGSRRDRRTGIFH